MCLQMEVEDEEQKNTILLPFNKKCDANSYKMFSKKYILPHMLKDYLGIVPNTWSTAVRKLKEAGLIYLSERELVADNVLYILIPPVVPTACLKEEYADSNEK